MRAEVAKLRSLPLPRWTLVIQVGLVVIGTLVVLLTGGETTSDYETAAQVTAAVGTGVGSLVLGVWMVGLEYGEKTMRRALTADPRRDRLVLAKLATMLLAVVATTAFVWVLAGVLAILAASVNGAGSPIEEIARTAAALLAANVIYSTVGFGVALLTRSMAGALTLTLVLVFVVDAALTAVPSFGEYTLGVSVEAIANAVGGGNEDTVGVEGAVIATAVWLTLLLGAGWTRFRRSDVG
jgi:ABC-type transport system involved in multi-copper enzyme maturation permease subunit